jgi:putative endonuclease
MPRNHDYFVYMLTDKSRGTLYIGMTNDLLSRVMQHRNPDHECFTQQYHCVVLVYYEHYPDVHAAIAREKQLKGWTRAKKNALVESMNPKWADLAEDLFS